MSETPLTNEELLKIAAEVREGKRPESDMQKYGLSVGERLTGEAAKQQLLSELEALGAFDDESEPADQK
jgi:hypothetical protein